MISVYFAALLLISTTLGVPFARFIRRRCPDCTLENLGKQVPPLYDWGYIGLIAAYIIFLLKSDDILKALPLRIQHYSFQILHTPFLAAIGFMSGFAVRFAFLTAYKGRVRMTAILIVLNLVVLVANSPIAPRLKSAVNPQGVVLQTSNSSCAAATLANIVRHTGRDLSERQAAEVLGTTMLGTHSAQIRYGLSCFGFRPETIEQEIREIDKISPPAVLTVKYLTAIGIKRKHMVAYFGQVDGKSEIWDPLIGRCLYTEEELYRIWGGYGIACTGNPL